MWTGRPEGLVACHSSSVFNPDLNIDFYWNCRLIPQYIYFRRSIWTIIYDVNQQDTSTVPSSDENLMRTRSRGIVGSKSSRKSPLQGGPVWVQVTCELYICTSSVKHVSSDWVIHLTFARKFILDLKRTHLSANRNDLSWGSDTRALPHSVNCPSLKASLSPLLTYSYLRN